MGLLDPIAGFGITLKTFFSKTFTEAYPTGPKVTAPRYHGRHQLNRWPDGLEKCVGCELCAWACPADAIYVEGASNTEDERFSPGERYGRVYQINYLRCILCGLCIEACPTRALTMTNHFELSDFTREDMIYEKHQLLAPVLPGMTAPPHERMLGDSEKAYFLGLPDTEPRPADANAGLPNVGWNKKDRAAAQAEVAELYANTPGRGDDPPGPPSVSGSALTRNGRRGSESGRPALESGEGESDQESGQ